MFLKSDFLKFRLLLICTCRINIDCCITLRNFSCKNLSHRMPQAAAMLERVAPPSLPCQRFPKVNFLKFRLLMLCTWRFDINCCVPLRNFSHNYLSHRMPQAAAVLERVRRASFIDVFADRILGIPRTQTALQINLCSTYFPCGSA